MNNLNEKFITFSFTALLGTAGWIISTVINDSKEQAVVNERVTSQQVEIAEKLERITGQLDTFDELRYRVKKLELRADMHAKKTIDVTKQNYG